MKNQNCSISHTGSSKGAAWYILLAACFSSLPHVFALDPPPRGGYPGEITALGDDALFNQPDVVGVGNTAIGFQTLYVNTNGGSLTAIGDSALHDNTTGDDNTGIGYFALKSNTTGTGNTAVGDVALSANTTGFRNTAIGDGALRYNFNGLDNTAMGSSALAVSNGTGNTSVGSFSLSFSNTGGWNTAVGIKTLAFNTSGSENTAIGDSALNQITSGSFNIGIGPVGGAKLTTGNYNIDIGNQGVAGESRTIRIGNSVSQRNTYVAGISGVTVASGVGVIIDNKGHLGTITSSGRYKDDIHPIEKASEAILALKPVSFRYKKELDPQGLPQFGLVAEEVEKVSPDLVARDDQGKPYTVRYDAVNAMLLNEFLKEHRKVEEQARLNVQQQATIAEQQKQINVLAQSVREQTARLQMVSDQFAASRRDPRLVGNRR